LAARSQISLLELLQNLLTIMETKQLILIVGLCTLCGTAFAEWRTIGTPHYGLPYLPPAPIPEPPHLLLPPPRVAPQPVRKPVRQPVLQPVPVPEPSGPYPGIWIKILTRVCRDPYRTIGGRTYDLSPVFEWLKADSPAQQPLPEWRFLVCKVISVTSDGLLVSSHEPNPDREQAGETVFLKNDPFQGTAVDGESFLTVARMDGRHQYTAILGAGRTVSAYDYGTPITDGEEVAGFRQAAAVRASVRASVLAAKQARETEQRQEQERQQRQRNEQAEQAEQQAEQQLRDLQNFERLERIESQTAKVVEFQKQRAAAGSASAQFDLGCRYSDGIGVPKDLELARQWLTKSAEQGNAQAKAKLTEL